MVRMRRRAPYETVEPFRVRLHEPRGRALRDALAKWTMTIPNEVWPDFPPEIMDRNADVFEALLAVADQAGGHSPNRARVTAVTLVTDKSEDKRSMGIRLLEDLKTVFGDRDRLHTEEILSELLKLNESPWDDIRGKPLDARGLANRLGKYQVKSKSVRVGEDSKKGYAREDLVDVWARYVTDSEARDTHSSKRIPTELVGMETPLPSSDFGVTSVTEVTGVTRTTNRNTRTATSFATTSRTRAKKKRWKCLSGFLRLMNQPILRYRNLNRIR